MEMRAHLDQQPNNAPEELWRDSEPGLDYGGQFADVAEGRLDFIWFRPARNSARRF